VIAYFDFQVQQCIQNGGNKSLVDYSDLKVRRHNGTRKLYGSVVYHIPMGNSYDAQGFAYFKQGGEYRLIPFQVPKKPFCNFFFDELYFYPEFIKASDFPEPDEKNCPLAAVIIQ